MNTDDRDTLSTADMVAAGQPASRPESRPQDRPDRPAPDGSRTMESREAPGALLPQAEGGELRHRWDTIQTGFVDEPRRAVEEADSLVAQTMKRVAEVFAQERDSLEKQWTRGQDVSTEDLRVALKRYRSFFDRLLAA
jgi:hypothetical protein